MFVGPTFLKLPSTEWPTYYRSQVPEDRLEIKKNKTLSLAGQEVTCALNTGQPLNFLERLITKTSKLIKLKRILGWIILFKMRLHRKISKIEMSCSVLVEAEKMLIRYAQNELNLTDYASLSLFKDAEGLIRVGGRLRQTKHCKQNPLLVPKGQLATLFIREEHEKSGHLGVEYALANLRHQGKWIARVWVKSVINQYVTCKRYFAKPKEQKMADLPVERITPSPPFLYTGVDCFGPCLTKRGRTEVKRWGCVFTCLSTRAIHLEKLNDLTTESFINALMRFISRRGRPLSILSDNRGNCVKANSELSKGISEWNQAMIEENLQQKHIQWKFNPPYSSHIGGIWERQIRTIRKVLIATLDVQLVTDDVFHTVLVLAEEIINRRPITKISDDPRDPSVLRPCDLLNMSHRDGSPTFQTFSADVYRKSWNQVQYLTDLFWTKWIRHYLPELQSRQKWRQEKPNLKIGDIVLITDLKAYRNVWPLGIVVDARPDVDGLVRTVKMKSGGKEITRATNKVVLLEGHI